MSYISQNENWRESISFRTSPTYDNLEIFENTNFIEIYCDVRLVEIVNWLSSNVSEKLADAETKGTINFQEVRIF